MSAATAITEPQTSAWRATTHTLDLPAADVVEYALALLDLGHGHWNEALNRLDVLADPAVSITALPDRIEATVRAGRRDEAAIALQAFEDAVARSQSAWALPRLASCRGLLADGEEAIEHFEEALRLRAQLRPFDVARIRLLYGEHLRRARRRADARVQLRAALETFERVRAEPWAERARAELGATGETARRRDPSALDELTSQELQIARLVAEGFSNKEIAAQRFLSPRTVDAHLRSVFSKLSITSRTQLARLSLEAGVAQTAAAMA